MITNLFKFFLIAYLGVSFSSIYFSDRGDFKLIFPYDFAIEVDTALVAVGAIPVTKVYCHEGIQDSLSLNNGSLYFMSITEYPLLTFPKDSVELMDYIIAQSIDQQVSGMNGILDYESDLDNENYHGKIVRISSMDDPVRITKAKYIIYKDYFIVLQVKTNRNDKHFRKAEEFLNSFKTIHP